MLYLPSNANEIEYTDDEVEEIVDFFTEILVPFELETDESTANIIGNIFLSDYEEVDGVETPVSP